MQQQDLSYQLNNASFPLKGIEGSKFSIEVISLENVYTAPKEFTHINGEEININTLVWGNNEKVDGKVTINNNSSLINVSATLSKDIRCIKVRFDDLPIGKLISLSGGDIEINQQGHIYHYPEGWRGLSYPLLVFKLNDGRFLYLKSLDKTVNSKHFFIKKTDSNLMRVDFVQENNGVQLNHSYTIPTIEYGIKYSEEEIYKTQMELMEKEFNLLPFEQNPIVPNWFKDISLVVTMHMEAFTGYIFHTYQKAYEDVKKLTKFIDGKHILVYLAGWEGRYYYKYGNYCPDDRLGGEAALKEAVNKIHALGCKVIAMYGMNLANKTLPQIKPIYQNAEFESVSGGKFHNGSVDWEGAHHYDFGDLVNLNIACPLWADELFKQIKENTEKFDFDGAFLDIAACYVNDKNYSLFEGLCAFSDRLRTIKKDFLVSGEGYYDGLSKAMPLFQSGHTDGYMNYHDRINEQLFNKYSREFAHLCLGDPSRGSSGVHELGTNDIYNVPLRKGIIPTISLVEDSIDENNPHFKEIINTALEYQKKYL